MLISQCLRLVLLCVHVGFQHNILSNNSYKSSVSMLHECIKPRVQTKHSTLPEKHSIASCFYPTPVTSPHPLPAKAVIFPLKRAKAL